MKNYIRQIIGLFSNNDYPMPLKHKIQQWLADEQHIEEKEAALKELWEKAHQCGIPENMNRSLRQMQRNTGIYIPSKQNLHLRFWQIAAGLFFAVSSVSIYLIWQKNQSLSPDLIQSYIPTSEMKDITLPDGTSVMLNSKSTLLYPKEFTGDTRSVYLIGEANFKVKPDKKHPFIVKSNSFQVTALGTEFNVSAYSDNNESTTTLLSGNVLVEFNDQQYHTILKPNEQLVYNKSTKKHSLLTPDIEEVTAWQRGELVFNNMHLEDIFTQLERKYPYTFVYSLHSLKTDTYSFRFPQKATLEEIIKIISRVAGDLEYKIEGHKCYLYHP